LVPRNMIKVGFPIKHVKQNAEPAFAECSANVSAVVFSEFSNEYSEETIKKNKWLSRRPNRSLNQKKFN